MGLLNQGLRLAPFFAISGLASGWTIWEQKFHAGALGRDWSQGWAERLAISGKVVWFYVAKLVWPDPLMFIYPRWKIDLANPVVYLPVLAVVVCLLVFWIFRNRGLWPLFFAFAYFIVSLFPVMDFFNVYFFRFSFVGDHFQYLASIGALALAGAGIVTALSTFLNRPSTIHYPLSTVLKAIPLALLLVLAVLSWRQSWMYLDHETLWRVTLTKNPNSFIVHNNLGNLLLRKGELDEAILHFRETMRLKPDYEVAYYNLANALLKRGQPDDAIPLYQKAVELDPRYIGAHNNLANVFLAKGRAREALAEYEIAMKLDPNSAILCANVAKLLATNPDAGLRNGRRALELAIRADQLSHGADPMYVATLGAAYAECGQFQPAIATARRALDLAWRQNNAGLAR